MAGECGRAPSSAALIHLAPLARRGSLPHRSCPPGRSWTRGDAVFQVFLDDFSDMLQAHVSVVSDVCFNVSCGCCKSRSECCIYCKRLSPMFHLFFVHVCCKFSDACLKCFIYLVLYVASVAFRCFKVDQDVAHVAMMFQLYVPNVLFVLDVCCNGFI
jgi:hypothetical protein